MKFIKDKVQVLDERFDDVFLQLDGVTRTMFIEGVMKEDNVTWDEAVKLIETNPMYSMGLKWAIYRNRNKMDLRTSRKEKKRQFLESLTPEELEQYNKGPAMNRWARRKMEKEAEREARADIEKLKRKIDSGELTDDDIPERFRAFMGKKP